MSSPRLVCLQTVVAMGVHDGDDHNSSSAVAKAACHAQILLGVANWGLEAVRLEAHLSSVTGPLVAQQDLAHTMGSEWLCK